MYLLLHVNHIELEFDNLAFTDAVAVVLAIVQAGAIV